MKHLQIIMMHYLEARTCEPGRTFKHVLWAPNTQVSLISPCAQKNITAIYYITQLTSVNKIIYIKNEKWTYVMYIQNNSLTVQN